MQRNDISSELTTLAFDFFYWFSRFEFALKNNHFLKSHKDGADAEPGWDEFVAKYHSTYSLSVEAQFLLSQPPKRQIVNLADELEWKNLGLSHCRSDLERISLIIRRIRNNLFHGGKHGVDDWDDETRTRELLTNGVSTLNQLAQLGLMNEDYHRKY